jgi:glutathione S-transferase
MKLYNSIGPNPHVVRMFLAEKGVTLPTVTVDLLGGENRKAPYVEKVNAAGQTPALELDNGRVVTEITVICEYLEEIYPDPALIGATPEERAETRKWTRRVDLNICEPMTNAFRAAEGRALFESRVKLVGAEGANDLKAIARDRIEWLSGQLGNKTYLCGNRFTLADILLYCFLEFGASVGQPLATQTPTLQAWFDRVKARASASA